MGDEKQAKAVKRLGPLFQPKRSRLDALRNNPLEFHEGLDPVLQPLPSAGEASQHNRLSMFQGCAEGEDASESVLPGGRVNTAPVIGVVFPGI